MTTSPMRRTRACLLATSIVLLLLSGSAAAQQTTAPVVLSGKYSDLHPEQKRIVDDWFRRLSEVLKQQISPEEGYDHLPTSDKTTFSAVTHALLRTPLTEESGATLGDSAMILVDKIDRVLGKIDGAGGDKQFRLYVQLKPNALEILGKSQEFDRTADNTVFHKGFPICFRSEGTPSIQVSITKDGMRADIDVDYRSSKFPVALINGHLTASNSDIRAGNNDERHNDRWAGVSSWWRSLLGLPLGDAPPEEEKDPGMKDPPKSIENAKPAVAIHDFLQVWLVDRKPQEVVGFFSDSAMSCMELEQGRPIDRGVARFSMFMGLRRINEAIGTVSDLSQAVVGVSVNKPQLRTIEQPYTSQFTLYDVREDLAEQFNCVNRLDPSLISAKAAKSTAFGKYVGAVFYLKTPQGLKGETVATLWAKQNKFWKLISYITEPEHEADKTAALAAPVEVPALAVDPGDPQLIIDSRDFYQKWFIRRRFNEAFQYISPRAYPCVNLYRADDVPEPASPVEAGQAIQQGLERVSKFAGAVKRLEEAITAPQPSHPDIKLVRHTDSAAFAMVAIPDSMALQADCSKMKPGEHLVVAPPTSAPKNYGQYYATGFQLTKAVEQPSVLWIIWTRENGQWKIVAYHVLTP
jgi:hypothetical protein